ncbi:MAG: amidase family protein, partial [SAR202 cluster bacterium]|nr:amidase family protein [SAR202 cluster bacterium]
PSVAFKLGDKMDDPVQMYLNDIFTQPTNIAGIPAISVQGGMVDGLPVGLQLMGPHMGEETLLRTAHAYEQATDWHTRFPDLY